ncbi:unnamed protein product [Caenorhabditis angaria]|uniref:ARID domain-containing protein n=1 Tax=Caenorhabditis angaria TaxID=860376 RepID=A0A9P1MSI8_9PELO|nr:unnamed protein product [Caenorhabditis angaria]
MSVRIDSQDPQLFVSMSSQKESVDETICEDREEEEEDETNHEDEDEEEKTKCSTRESPEVPNINVFDIEMQQKAIQRLTSTLGLSNLRAPALNLPPIFQAALQHGPFSLQQQLLGLASGLSAISPGVDDYDEENGNNGEPEDLTLSFSSFRQKENKSDDTNDLGSNPSGPGWSYEEQFKQLYELSDDVKRKEWLDDWLNFMHRIGKPVTRIPIMAKQVLDLYELYRLVVQHGGLVEIINKKLWREITKGLNLPSSITSAAFTLRTQYQKYLYDYECEKERLSNPADLQQAIDGNRREAPGRRTAPTFPLPFPLPHSNVANNLLNKQLGVLRHDLLDDENTLNSLQASGLFSTNYGADQMALIEAHQRQFERAQRAAEQVARQSLGLGVSSSNNLVNQLSGRESTSSIDSEIPAKRVKLENENNQNSTNSASKSTNGAMKITTKQKDNSMTVSMEINGIVYQGVLFALDENASKSET